MSGFTYKIQNSKVSQPIYQLIGCLGKVPTPDVVAHVKPFLSNNISHGRVLIISSLRHQVFIQVNNLVAMETIFVCFHVTVVAM